MSRQKQLQEAMWAAARNEFDGIVVGDDRNAKLREIPEGYRGLVLHVNDHGNVSLLRAFKNGKTHLIADCV